MATLHLRQVPEATWEALLRLAADGKASIAATLTGREASFLGRPGLPAPGITDFGRW